MKIKLLLICLIIFLVNSCTSKSEKKVAEKSTLPEKPTAKTDQFYVQDSTKIITVNYHDFFPADAELKIENITLQEFKTLKPQKYFDSIAEQNNGDFFTLKTKNNTHRYKVYKDDGGDKGHNGIELIGFYPKLDLFALTDNSTSESLGFGELFLVDDRNDYEYRIISFGDGSVELPIPSPNNKFLVYYDNSVYENKNCDIEILRINSDSPPKDYLKEHLVFHSDDFRIEQIIWKTDHIFYFKGYQQTFVNGEVVKNFQYYKATFE